MFVIVCLFSFFLYTYIYKTCLYFSTDRGTYREEAANAWNWWKESVLVQFFCLFYSERSSWTSCGRREPTPLLSEGLMGNNDCVINMADRYCYQPFFFLKNFSYILSNSSLIITVVQMLSTVYSLWGIMVLQYAVHKIDSKKLFHL